MEIRSEAGSKVGVPPPKNTVVNLRFGAFEIFRAWPEKTISDISDFA
jgi:hypothetical protein